MWFKRNPRRTSHTRTVVLGFLYFLTTSVYSAEPVKPYQGELFLMRLPDKGWHKVSNAPEIEGDVIRILPPNLNEFLPPGETVKNWKEMISRQIWKSLKGVDPAWYLMKRKKEITDGLCPGQDTQLISSGERDGYAEAVALAFCPGGEITMYKAIQGRDSFYVVWRSLRVAPFHGRNPPISQQTIYEWTVYFRENVFLCDLRIPGSCPPNVEDNPEKF